MLNFKIVTILQKHWPRTMPVIVEKALKNILIWPGKLSEISRNGPLKPKSIQYHY